MSDEKKVEVPQKVIDQFNAEIEKFRLDTLERMQSGKAVMGYIQIASGLHPEDTVTRFYPLASVPLEGHPADTFSAITVTRDMIFALMAINDQYGLNIGDAMQLAALAHPTCSHAMQGGQLATQRVTAGGKRVVRDFVNVGAGGEGGAG